MNRDELKIGRQLTHDELFNLLVKHTGCTPNAAKTALAICASSAQHIQQKGET